MKPVYIIDYGSGNIHSIFNALNFLGISNNIISDPKKLSVYEKIILPGVGSFEYAKNNLDKTYFSNSIIELVNSKNIKLLGICLGMQLLYEYSEEDNGCKGLGIISGKVSKIKIKKNIRVPNVGWRKVKIKKDTSLLSNIRIDPIFYFVHSYGCENVNKSIVTGVLSYGKNYDVIIESENIFGTQFHPEKSQTAGLQILKNFSDL